MLNSNILRFSLVFALGAFAVACGDDDPIVTTDSGTDSGATDTGSDTGMEDTGMEDTGMEDTPAGGLCINEADLAIIETEVVTPAAQECGIGCLADADPRTCSIDCIVADTGISEDCAGCYGDIVACSIEFCLAACATDPTGEECGTCQAENCVPAFETCSGIVTDGE